MTTCDQCNQPAEMKFAIKNEPPRCHDHLTNFLTYGFITWYAKQLRETASLTEIQGGEK